MYGDSPGPHPIAKWSFDEGTGQTISPSHGKKLKITNSALTGTLGGSAENTDNDPTRVTNPANCMQGNCLEFNSANPEYANVGDTNLDINSACIWINPSTTTQPIMSFDATSTYLRLVSGVVTPTGFTSPTVYVNGKATTAISTGWSYVCVTSETPITANAVRFGIANGAYFTGKVDVTEFFNFVLTPSEVASLYNLGAVSFR